MEGKVAQRAVELDRFRKQLESLPRFHQTSLSSSDRMKEIRAGPLPLKLVIFEDYRKTGQSLFNEGKYQDALDHYEEALSLFRWLENKGQDTVTKLNLEMNGEDLGTEVVKCLIVCYSNIAICNLKLESCKEAASACDEVLKLDPENAKAKYRKAVAITNCLGSGLEETKEAIQLLKEASAADPSNYSIKQKFIELKESLRTQEAKSKEVCKSIFSHRSYDDVQSVNSCDVIPKTRLREIANFIEKGETTTRQLEAEGKDSEAEKIRNTVSKVKQARDELQTQLENLKQFRGRHGVALGDVLMTSEIQRLKNEKQTLVPLVPRVIGKKNWDWVFLPAVILVSVVTLAAYWLERGG